MNVSTQYNYNPGVLINTSGNHSDGVYARTSGDVSYGVVGGTSGYNSHGVFAPTSGDNSYGVYASTSGNDSHGVFARSMGNESSGVYGWSEKYIGVYGRGKEAGGYFTTLAGGTSILNLKPGVNVSTQYNYNPGVLIKTTGAISNGVSINTSDYGSTGVYASTSGNNSPGVYARTSGYDSPGVWGWSDKDVGVKGTGKEAGGYFTTTAGGAGWSYQKPGVKISTQYDYNPGVRIDTLGHESIGVFAHTTGNNSPGVETYTEGDESIGVYAFSKKDYAITADTARTDHNYAFFTYTDNIYVGGKSTLVGAVDPIIVEGFNADPAVAYELGDVVCLDESGTVKPCTKADDTRVVGVVGPTVELKDGELTVVIMGHQGAKPDEEYVQVLEQQLERAEVQKAESKLLGLGETDKNVEREITMLRSQLEEAKSVTRQVVRVKADASYSAIKAGDLLTTSPTSGHAMKAQPVNLGGFEIYRPGTIIGKALEPLESGTGLIDVFVTLQ